MATFNIDSTENNTPLTYDELCYEEPLLQALESHAKSFKGRKGFCANEVWYNSGCLKSMLSRLVGYRRKDHEILGTCEAYDVVYQHLWHLLPDCNHDGACRVKFS